MLAKLLNANRTIRRLVAIAIAGVGALCAAWLVFAAIESIVSAREAIDEKRETLGQLQAVAALAKRLENSGTAEKSTGTSTEFLTGESEAVIRGGLQTRLNSIAAANGVTVLSAANAPALNEAGVDFIGVRADLSGSLENVHNAIFAIETSLPVLFIRDATLRTTDIGPAANQTTEPELFAEVLFYGALQTKPAAAAGGPKP